MSQIIAVSIDLSKINKNLIVEGKSGGKYYNLTILVSDKKDQYGNDVSVVDKQSKEEISAKAKKTYLGNGRVIYGGTSTGSSTPAPRADGKIYENASQPSDDGLPF